MRGIWCVQGACYNIGGCNFVLDDLENGILRGNAPGAATLGMLLKLPWLSKGPFKQGDPRAQHVSHEAQQLVAHGALSSQKCSCVACNASVTSPSAVALMRQVLISVMLSM